MRFDIAMGIPSAVPPAAVTDLNETNALLGKTPGQQELPPEVVRLVLADAIQHQNVVGLVGKIDELGRGNRIEFREFGIFELKRRKPRTARNPKTGDSVQVPEKTVVSFKPGKVMKAKVMDTVPTGITETDGDGDEDEDEDEADAPSGAPSPAAPQPPAAGR